MRRLRDTPRRSAAPPVGASLMAPGHNRPHKCGPYRDTSCRGAAPPVGASLMAPGHNRPHKCGPYEIYPVGAPLMAPWYNGPHKCGPCTIYHAPHRPAALRNKKPGLAGFLYCIRTRRYAASYSVWCRVSLQAIRAISVSTAIAAR